jgi:hypothetical protein
MKRLSRLSSRSRQFLNFSVTFVSVLLCILILPTRFPGMELLGISPNWLLIWLVAWSIKRKRTVWGAASMGMVLGFLQDAMTAPHPTHAVSLVVVGVLTVVLLKTWSIPADIVERDCVWDGGGSGNGDGTAIFGYGRSGFTGNLERSPACGFVFCYSQQSLGSGNLFSPQSFMGNDQKIRKILVS